jgi:hypothetical protein
MKEPQGGAERVNGGTLPRGVEAAVRSVAEDSCLPRSGWVSLRPEPEATQQARKK